jgi:predicted permease
MDIMVVINQMIQLFLVIALGYMLNRIGIFDQTLNKKLSTLLLSVTTPAMILN